jgi:STE24 endopeptidase
MNTFTAIFLLALTANVVVGLWLSRRQIMFVRSHRGAVPHGFEAAISPADHAKAAEYGIAKQRLGSVELVYDAAVVLLLTVGGGIAALGEWARGTIDAPLWSGVAQVLATLGVVALLGLPFSIYRTFVLEQRFGFNRTRPLIFAADHLKGWLLGLLLGGAATAGILWVMAIADRWWWLLGWAGWIGLSLLITWAWPRLIAPLFNRFVPLDDPALRERIDALLARCGFRARDVYVMDGSRRSAHGNAYFTGLGREKRIVFFDTLLSTLEPSQVESVLAHELAHFKLHHIPQRLLAGAAATLAGFALLGWLVHQPWFFTGLGVPEPSDAAALLLFVLATPAFTWFVSPLMSAWSRRHEYEADAFAARYSDPGALAAALVRLYRDNASTLTPDPLYSAFHDSHPPPASRVERLHRLAARAGGAR